MTYLQVLAIYVLNGTRSVKVNSLLDSGTDSTLVTKILTDKSKLAGEDQPLTLPNAVRPYAHQNIVKTREFSGIITNASVKNSNFKGMVS